MASILGDAEQTFFSRVKKNASQKIGKARTRIMTQFNPVAQEQRNLKKLENRIYRSKLKAEINTAKALKSAQRLLAKKDGKQGRLAKNEVAEALANAHQEFERNKSQIIQRAQEARAARKAALKEARVKGFAPFHESYTVGGHKKTRKNKKRTKHNIRSRKQRK